MTDLRMQFQEILDQFLAGSSGGTVGGAAGWCLPGGDLPGGEAAQGIVYGGEVTSRTADELIAPPSDDTLWQIGSVSKTFAATLLSQQAVSDPQLLTRPVLPDIERWFGPGGVRPPQQLTEITYNRLVSMWAGLVKGNRDLGSSAPDSYPVADLFLNLLKPGSYTGQPCTWLYSNLSLSVLGWALTSVYGVAPESPDDLPSVYLDLLRDEILEPLDIPATWAADADLRQLPVGWAGGRPTVALDVDWPADDPAGALTLTAPAVLAWVRANLAPGSVLSGDVLQLLRTPIVPTGEAADTFDGGTFPAGGASCRGWFLFPSTADPGTSFFNKNGRVEGFVSGVAYAPPEALSSASAAGVFVVANDSDLQPKDVADQLLAVALGETGA